MAARSIARLSPAIALLGIGLVAATFAADRATAPVTAWWAWIGCGVFGPLLFAARRTLWPLSFGVVLAAVAIVLFPRQGPVALAVPTLLFAVAVALGSGDLVDPRHAEGSRGVRERLRWIAVAFSAQLVIHADRLWDRAGEPETLLRLALAPVVAGWALSQLARFDRSIGLTAGCVAFAAGAGWSLEACVALGLASVASAAFVGASSGARIRMAALLLLPLPALTHEPLWVVVALTGASAAAFSADGWVGRSGRLAVAASALGVLLAAALPFSHRAPLESVLRSVAMSPTGLLETVHVARDRALSAKAPTAEWDLNRGPIGALVIDAFLIEAATLPCGQRIATVSVESAGAIYETELRVGRDLFDWAARRPDVLERSRCREATPFERWLPPTGRFFGALGRTHLAVEPALHAQRLRITRADDLPPELRLVLRRIVTVR